MLKLSSTHEKEALDMKGRLLAGPGLITLSNPETAPSSIPPLIYGMPWSMAGYSALQIREQRLNTTEAQAVCRELVEGAGMNPRTGPLWSTTVHLKTKKRVPCKSINTD